MKPKKPTPTQVAAELAALKALVGKIVPYSMFGDNNDEKLADAIAVIRDGMDEEDIAEAYGPLDEDDPDFGEDNAATNGMDGRSSEREGNALDVYYWVSQGEGDRPSEGWPLLGDNPFGNGLSQ